MSFPAIITAGSAIAVLAATMVSAQSDAPASTRSKDSPIVTQDVNPRLKAQITTAGLTAMLQAAQVLTPEQRQTVIDARNEWKSRFTRLRNMMLSLFGESAVE